MFCIFEGLPVKSFIIGTFYHEEVEMEVMASILN